jgi:hypothetical protein
MQQGFNSGAKFRHVVGSAYVKSEFVKFMSDANVASFRYAVSSGGQRNTIVATADFYEGPFGKVLVHPSTIQSVAALARNVFFLDPDYAEFIWLRKIQEDKGVAKTGDADKGVLIGEGTLKVKNEKGLGIAADIFGIDATH